MDNVTTVQKELADMGFQVNSQIDWLESSKQQSNMVQAVLGGKFVYLECEDKDALLNFYGDNGFVIFGKRDLDRDERDRQSGQYLVQLLKYLGD